MPIHHESRSGVAVLRIENGKVNALDSELGGELAAAIDRLGGEPQPPPVVLTGTGGSFSAGVDLFRVLEGGDAYLDDFLPRIGGLVRRLMAYARPVVAAINGHAIAGGYVLACGCDVRLMARSSGKVGITELPVGVPFPWMALEAVRRVAGDRRGREMVLSGSLYPAERALELGLVDGLTEPAELLDTAVERATQLGEIPPEAFRLTKAQLSDPIFRAAAECERQHDAEVLSAWKSTATRQAIRSFLERTIGTGRDG